MCVDIGIARKHQSSRRRLFLFLALLFYVEACGLHIKNFQRFDKPPSYHYIVT